MARAPDHAPLAVQLVALVELHVSVEVAPLVTEVGFAARLTVGAGGGAPTVTVVLREIDPAELEQASVKVLV